MFDLSSLLCIQILIIQGLWTDVQFLNLIFDFVCLLLHEQFFNYLAAVTITGDRAANLDLCLTLLALSSEDSFMCHMTLVYTVSSKRPVSMPHSGM
jgi:hypothetical protein